MRKKVLWFLIILLGLLFLSPIQMVPISRENAANIGTLNCKDAMPPLRGCINKCFGFAMESCQSSDTCYDQCDSICYGLVTGTCVDNVIIDKFAFWLDKIKK